MATEATFTVPSDQFPLGTVFEQLPGVTVTRIETTLHHVHLPKIADSGLVDYDPERHVVEPTARLDRIEPSLSKILDGESERIAPVDG